jgi:thiol-disulfide isomerase/thioredoxin
MSVSLRGAVAASLVLMVAIAPEGRAQGESGIRVGAKAPVVSVKDLDGKQVDLGQWIGHKPAVLEFWATWCENCEALLPRFVEARKVVGEKVEFLWVNVTVNQTRERVRRYVEQHKVPFRVLYDEEGTSTRAYEAPATSYVVIVDAKGNVVYTGVGADQRFEPALRRVAGVPE